MHEAHEVKQLIHYRAIWAHCDTCCSIALEKENAAGYDWMGHYQNKRSRMSNATIDGFDCDAEANE